VNAYTVASNSVLSYCSLLCEGTGYSISIAFSTEILLLRCVNLL
jgi:hypothetical protein